MSKTEINDSAILKIKANLPKYILEGLYFIDENENENENGNTNNTNSQIKTLSEIWKDFTIYDNIIDYYYSTLWGVENICKKVDIEYNGSWMDVCSSLLKEYGVTNSKKNKNILMEELLKLLNMYNEESQVQENLDEKDTKQKNIHNNIINFIPIFFHFTEIFCIFCCWSFIAIFAPGIINFCIYFFGK